MHTIHKRDLTLDDFSCDRLDQDGLCTLGMVIQVINRNSEIYRNTRSIPAWDNIIQLLPSSFNQLRTVTLNYENLLNMYHARRKHKLDEWREFCKVIETLPYAKELICDVYTR
jgi:hypothetical protein